jgi:hypothetical protein
MDTLEERQKEMRERLEIRGYNHKTTLIERSKQENVLSTRQHLGLDDSIRRALEPELHHKIKSIRGASSAKLSVSTDREPSHLYVISCKGTEIFKIGRAYNVLSRLSGLKTGCPYELELVKTYENCGEYERAAHLELCKFRMNGEWFSGSVVELMTQIDRLVDRMEQARLKVLEREKHSEAVRRYREQRLHNRGLKLYFKAMVRLLGKCSDDFPLGFTSRDVLNSPDLRKMLIELFGYLHESQYQSSSWLTAELRKIQNRPFLGVFLVQNGFDWMGSRVLWRVLNTKQHKDFVECRMIAERQAMQSAVEKLGRYELWQKWCASTSAGVQVDFWVGLGQPD